MCHSCYYWGRQQHPKDVADSAARAEHTRQKCMRQEEYLARKAKEMQAAEQRRKDTALAKIQRREESVKKKALYEAQKRAQVVAAADVAPVMDESEVFRYVINLFT